MVSSSLLDFSSDCILVADSCRSSHSHCLAHQSLLLQSGLGTQLGYLLLQGGIGSFHVRQLSVCSCTHLEGRRGTGEEEREGKVRYVDLIPIPFAVQSCHVGQYVYLIICVCSCVMCEACERCVGEVSVDPCNCNA